MCDEQLRIPMPVVGHQTTVYREGREWIVDYRERRDGDGWELVRRQRCTGFSEALLRAQESFYSD